MQPVVAQSEQSGADVGESMRIVLGGLAVMGALVIVGPLLHLWCVLVMGWALLRAPWSRRSSG